MTTPFFPGFACVRPGGPYQVFAVGPVSWQTYCGDGGGSDRSSSAEPACQGIWYANHRQEVTDEVWVQVGTNLQPDCIRVDARAGPLLCSLDSDRPSQASCRTVRDDP